MTDRLPADFLLTQNADCYPAHDWPGQERIVFPLKAEHVRVRGTVRESWVMRISDYIV